MGEWEDGIVDDGRDVGFVWDHLERRVEVIEQGQVMLICRGVEGMNAHDRYTFRLELWHEERINGCCQTWLRTQGS